MRTLVFFECDRPQSSHIPLSAPKETSIAKNFPLFFLDCIAVIGWMLCGIAGWAINFFRRF